MNDSTEPHASIKTLELVVGDWAVSGDAQGRVRYVWPKEATS